MRKLLLILGLFAALPVFLQAATPLTSVRQIRRLTLAHANQGIPVQLEAVVTYYEPAEHMLFVRDSTGPIFIRTHNIFPFATGDLIQVRGVTAGSYHPVIASEDMHRLGTAPLPSPSPVTFPGLMSGQWDCSYVTVTGKVLSATMQQTIGAPFLLMEVLMDGGSINVHVQKPQGLDPSRLLDSQVVLTGVSGGRFDGKFQLVGSNLYLTSPAGMRIVASPPADPAALTPMDQVLGSYNSLERSPRLRVHGSVTLYEPGSQLVIESGGKAVLVHTHQNSPVNIGDLVYATGFADANDYTQSLDHGQFLRTSEVAPIASRPAAWEDAVLGDYAFNLISINGRLVEQVHESSQDTLFIDSGGHVFSAALRHPGSPASHLPSFPAGSQVRVSGVCFVQNGGPWNGALEFELHLRNARDVQVLGRPSWWTVAHLLYVIGALAFVVLAALVWGELLRRRVHRQTRLISRTLADEAERERHQAVLEKQRGRVLEAINSRLPLDQVLRMITELIREQTDGLECWCELAATGAVESSSEGSPPEKDASSHSRRDILSGSGERLGSLVFVWNTEEEHHAFRSEILDMGTSLAALAIDNRRLYEGLLQRSQYDQLTGVPNRFLLDSRLQKAFAGARHHGHSFALVYLDLDRFKSVNDRYGHRIGDIYLQHVGRRLLEKLRDQDTLARVGGDEFIALIPAVSGRSEADEIAFRLSQCFDSPFRIDGHSIEGSASIGIAVYPEDGTDEEELKRFADSAMYASKQQQVLDWE